MILIEGMDGSGKSTLAQALSAHFQLPIILRERPLSGAEFIQQSELLNGIEMAIFDRVPIISELIYSRVLNRPKVSETHTLFKYYEQAIYGPHFLIYCRPNLPNIYNSVHTLENMKGVREHWSDLVIEYDQFFNRVKAPYYFRYNYTDSSFQELTGEITQYFNVLQSNSQLWERLL